MYIYYNFFERKLSFSFFKYFINYILKIGQLFSNGLLPIVCRASKFTNNNILEFSLELVEKIIRRTSVLNLFNQLKIIFIFLICLILHFSNKHKVRHALSFGVLLSMKKLLSNSVVEERIKRKICNIIETMGFI